MAAIQSPGDVQNGTLPNATYFFGLGGDTSLVHGAHFKWDNAIVANITFYRGSFKEVAISSVVAGDWVSSKPASAQVDVDGGTYTAATGVLAIAGGTAGGACYDIGNNAQRTLICKVVVTNPGFLRICAGGKV